MTRGQQNVYSATDLVVADRLDAGSAIARATVVI